MEDNTGTPNSQRHVNILDKFLPEGYSADPEVSLGGQSSNSEPTVPSPSHGTKTRSSATTVSESSNNVLSGSIDIGRDVLCDGLESSLKLQGGDIHRDMFKIKARANSLRRAATFSHQPSPRLSSSDELSYIEQRTPGGFRRHHLQQQARKMNGSGAPMGSRNFIDFLDLYGSFAGEDLEDDDSSEDESAIDGEQASEPSEQSPLISRSSSRRRSSRQHGREGDASTVKTFFTLIKAFIGTGIMFLPKAFRNGGILFSSLTLIGVSLISCLCFRLLLQCRQRYGGGYGEIGASIVGPRFRKLILGSIALSQLGFVCTGLIFTAENLHSFLLAISRNHTGSSLNVPSLIALQLVPLIPLALIRNISKLGPVAVLADVFIFVGLLYIWQYDAFSLAKHGIAPSVMLFNPSSFALTIGSAVFTFEGIGLILPIQSSMRKPEHFGGLLFLVMLLITLIFISVGALCYATFGENTKIQIISNFPQDSAAVNAVQVLYSLAVLAGEPVQLFPAVRIIETSLFGQRATGKKSIAIKWQKNAVRATVMSLCVGISIVGSSDLDKFVALIGSFACVPLVYIYPPYLHYRGIAQSIWTKSLDGVLIFIGLAAMVYTTSDTVVQWIQH
ncbi:hypothetical protein E4U53_007687 [Claviceps sorghi]|nr:hypothetical protein E4U53_007687 [Claviceps sorghi]